MPPLRIFLTAIPELDIDELEKIIKANEDNFAKINKNLNVERPGFYKQQVVFKKILDDYYTTDYIETDTKTLPSLNTELFYFKYLDNITETEERMYPIFIKLILNRRKGVLCLYSKQVVTNDKAEKLIMKLHKDHNFNFKFKPVNYVFKKDQLDELINILEIKDYTAISIWDKDNKLSIKNPKKLTESNKVISFIDEIYKGNWSHITIPIETFEIRLNNQNQKFITFENNYIDDMHLVKAVDYLINKLLEVVDLSGSKQVFLDKFLKK